MTKAKRTRSEYKRLHANSWRRAQKKLSLVVDLFFKLSGASESPQHLLRISVSLSLYLMAPQRSGAFHNLVHRLARPLPPPGPAPPAPAVQTANTSHLKIIIHNQRQMMRGIQTIMGHLHIPNQDDEYKIYSLNGSSGSSLSSAPDSSDEDDST